MIVSEDKRQKRLALIYCADNGINFEEFYYKREPEKKKTKKTRKNPDIFTVYESLDEIKENYRKDCYCYHDTEKDKWFFKVSKYLNDGDSWKELSKKHPYIEKYKIERIYELRGESGTRLELAKLLNLSETTIYNLRTKKPIGFKITQL